MIIAVVLTLVGFAVVGKAFYIMTAKKQYWTDVADRLKRDSVSVKPKRGNILSCDGQLMASSIPEYKIYMDFKAGGEEKDSIWQEKVDSRLPRSLSSTWRKVIRKCRSTGPSGLAALTTTPILK